MHLFVILQFFTILCILICCEAPRTLLDLALYQIKYIIIIIRIGCIKVSHPQAVSGVWGYTVSGYGL